MSQTEVVPGTKAVLLGYLELLAWPWCVKAQVQGEQRGMLAVPFLLSCGRSGSLVCKMPRLQPGQRGAGGVSGIERHR